VLKTQVIYDVVKTETQFPFLLHYLIYAPISQQLTILFSWNHGMGDIPILSIS